MIRKIFFILTTFFFLTNCAHHTFQKIYEPLIPSDCQNCVARNGLKQELKNGSVFVIAEFVPKNTLPNYYKATTLGDTPPTPAHVMSGIFSADGQLIAKEPRKEFQSLVPLLALVTPGRLHEFVTILGRGQDGNGMIVGFDVEKNPSSLSPVFTVPIPADCTSLVPGAKSCHPMEAMFFDVPSHPEINESNWLSVLTEVKFADGKKHSAWEEHLYLGYSLDGKFLKLLK